MHGRGRLAEDLLVALARQRLDVRDHVVTRIDRSPRDLVEAWGGSPLGVRAGLPFVGLSAALVAQAVGPARG